MKEQEKKAAGQALIADRKLEREAPYRKRLKHLAGEEVSGELQGGHVLSLMKKAHPKGIWLSHAEDKNEPWLSYWTDDLTRKTYKWSSFFPGKWTETEILALADPQTECKFEIFKANDTMYPMIGKKASAAPTQPLATKMTKA